MSLSYNDDGKQYDYCLISLWSHQVLINPMYHFVRNEINKITADITLKKLKKVNSGINISNDDKTIMRYQVKYPFAPALLVLGAVLEKSFSINLVSLNIEKERIQKEDWLNEAVKEIASKTKYGCLISFVTPELDQLYLCSRLIKQYNSNLSIIVGGVHATYKDKELLSIKDIDYVIRGEGEITIDELCHAINNKDNVSSIRGITYRKNDQIIRNPDREFMGLENTPVPAYHLIEDFIDKVVITTMFARGCPHQCKYCAESAFWKSSVRFKNVKKFVDELEILVNTYNLHFIHIADSTFGTDRTKLIELCDELEARNLQAFFSVNIRPDVFKYMGEEMLIRLRELNFVEMLMGVESADPKVVNYYSRTQNNEGLYSTLSRLKEIGIPFIKLYLMFGSPSDNRNSFEQTIKMVETLLEEKLIFYSTGKYYVPSIGSTIYSEEGNKLEYDKSVQLDRYNSPPLYVPDETIAQEIDIYIQLLQVVQYRYYMKQKEKDIQQIANEDWEKYVSSHYDHGFYY